MFLTKCVVNGITMRGGCRNPLKSGQCFLRAHISRREALPSVCETVAIPSNRVNVSYTGHGNVNLHLSLRSVAIPSNRVNVSYLEHEEIVVIRRVAIPSNRVNVSYLEEIRQIHMHIITIVAIPSNRVNVSYV